MRQMMWAGIATLLTAGVPSCASSLRAGPPDPPDPWFAALPKDTRIADMTPGRFAATYDYQGEASCSHSWASTSSRATVVLNLTADRTATGCRGRNYFNVIGSNDELIEIRKGLPHEPPRETKHTEQQGMRGRWQRDGRAIVVDLEPDAGVCPTRTGGEKPQPWHLRCAFVEPTARSAEVREPVLACAWRNDSEELGSSTANWDLQAGYVTSQVIPGGEWMLLAPGAGLRLTERKIGARLYERSQMSWQAVVTPIPFDDWSAPASTAPTGRSTGD